MVIHTVYHLFIVCIIIYYVYMGLVTPASSAFVRIFTFWTVLFRGC